MDIKNKLTNSILKNPIAWILGLFLVISIYGNYKTGMAFTEVCRMITTLTDEFNAYEMLFVKAEYDIKDINNIFSDESLKKISELQNAKTPIGDAFRVNYYYWKKLRKACENRLSELENYDYE